MYSFQERIVAHTVQAKLRRIGDLTVPNRPPDCSMVRTTNRHNRAIPTLLCPWGSKGPEVERCTTVITKDIGDEGVGLLLTQPLAATDVVLGYLLPGGVMSNPWFFRGTVRHTTAIGGDFWVLGVALTDSHEGQYRASYEALSALAQKLLPPIEAEKPLAEV